MNEDEDMERKGPAEKRSLSDKIIIDADSRWKSIFDVSILFLVGYSCFTSLFYVAFGQPTNKFH